MYKNIKHSKRSNMKIVYNEDKIFIMKNGLMCGSYMVLKFKSAQLKIAVIRQGICL